jgi:hypothetical protein
LSVAVQRKFYLEKKEYEINGILMQKVGTAVICVFINENFKKLGNSYLPETNEF